MADNINIDNKTKDLKPQQFTGAKATTAPTTIPLTVETLLHKDEQGEDQVAPLNRAKLHNEGSPVFERSVLTRSWSNFSEFDLEDSRPKPKTCPTNFGVFSIQGKRKTQEDAHSCLPNAVDLQPKHKPASPETEGRKLVRSVSRPSSPPPAQSKCNGFFGVFDGHGGEKCSEFVANQLSDLLFQDSAFGSDVEGSLVRAFGKVEAAWTTVANDKNLDGGTTALVAVFVGSNAKGGGHTDLYVANVGDSEAVLCRGGKAVAASSPHNMKKNESERTRIKEAGGVIYKNRIGHPALNPQFFSIAVTRAIGDLIYKDPGFTKGKCSGLTAEPEVRKIRMTAEDQFMILACDGLWDVVTHQQAVSFVIEQLGDQAVATADFPKITEALANFAFERGSTDNITVLLIGLL